MGLRIDNKGNLIDVPNNFGGYPDEKAMPDAHRGTPKRGDTTGIGKPLGGPVSQEWPQKPAEPVRR